MKTVTLILTTCLLTLQVVPSLAADSAETEGRVKNHPPMVIQVEGLPEEVVPLSGGAREITFSFMAKDANGWQDIARAEAVLYAPDNSTYMREANVTGVSGGDGASHWFNATFTMWYYELPTKGENYTLHIRVLDKQGEWSKPRFAEFEYAELAAISITTTDDGPATDGAGDANETNETNEPTLGFGGTDPGTESDITNLNITNTGNVVVDLELYGTDLVNEEGYVIPVSAVRYGLDPELDDEAALTQDPYVFDVDLAPGADSALDLFWKLRVPTGDEQYVPAGTYAGSVTLSALDG